MIFTDRKITIRNGKSSINEPVILYRGDYEVSIKFTIMESKFRFKSGVNLVDSEKASHGQLAILTPYGGNVFSEIVKCEDGTVTFTLTKEMIDQLEEVGLYSFQIRLFDYYRESRVSIPPVEFGIEVREPVASEDHDNSVNNAIVGYSIAKIVDPKNENVGPTFNDNGDYNETKWQTGDRITEGKLNKIEDAIDTINQNEIDDVAALDKRITNNFNVLYSTKADKNEVFSMANMGQDIKEAMTGGSVAVVGVDAVDTINIKQKAVTREKLDADTNKLLDVTEGLMYNYTDNLKVPTIKVYNSAVSYAYFSQTDKSINYETCDYDGDSANTLNDALYFEENYMRFRYSSVGSNTFIVTSTFIHGADNIPRICHFMLSGTNIILREHMTSGNTIRSVTITNGVLCEPSNGDLMTVYVSSTEIKMDGETASGETYNVFTIPYESDINHWFYKPVVGFLITNSGSATLDHVYDIRFPSRGEFDVARATELQSVKETVNELEIEISKINSEIYDNGVFIPSTEWVDTGGAAVCVDSSVSMSSTSSLIDTYDWVTVSNDEIYGLEFTTHISDGWYVLETNSDNTLAIAVSASFNNKVGGKGGWLRLFTSEGRGELMEATFIDTNAQPVSNSRCVIERISDHKYQIKTMQPEETDYTLWIEVDLTSIDGNIITSSTMTSDVTINIQDFHTSLGLILYSGYANKTLMTDIMGLSLSDSSLRKTVINILADLNIYPDSDGEVSANVVDLVMFMGQSNMAGRGVAAESPVVPTGHGYEFRAISDPTKLYPIVEPFGVNENNSSSGVSESTKTGSMVSSFVLNYYKVTKVPIVAVSCSKGGTSISWWQPGGDPLNDAIARHELAKNWLETNGYVIRHDFMVWCQGCSDGDGRTSTDDYTQGIKNMIEAMMTCGVEKCFLVRIGNQRDDPTMYDDIIQAQTELCKTYENAVLVSCKLAEMAELGLMKDLFHYLQEGYNIVGKDAGINTAFYINNLKEPTMWDPENDNLYFSYKN